jgi:hypothetical protein
MIEDAGIGPLERVVAELSLRSLGLRGAGPLVRLPSGPGHRRRRMLRVPVQSRKDVVLKYAVDPTEDEEQSLFWEHQVTSTLHSIAASPSCPLPSPLVPHPLDHLVEIPSVRKNPFRMVVSARQYVEPGPDPLTARAIGQLIARLHILGTHPSALSLLPTHPTNTLCGLDAEIFARTVAAPGHPFRTQQSVFTALFTVLQRRVTRALELDPHPLLAHRDLHPLNCVPSATGPVALDWAEAGWGSRAEDFAWLHLAVARYGAPRRVLLEAMAGYEEILPRLTPTWAQVKAAGQVRELVCLAFSIMNAGLDPAHLREAQIGLPILHDPDARTPRWTALFNPGIFRHPVFGESVMRTQVS